MRLARRARDTRALLAHGGRISTICRHLEARHFADPINAFLYAKIMQMSAAGKLADVVTLRAHLCDTGQIEKLDEVGGATYLTQLLMAIDPAVVRRDVYDACAAIKHAFPA